MVALRLPVIHGTSCNQLVTEIRHLAVSLNWDITKLYQTIGLLMKNNQVWQETTCVLHSTKDTIPAIHFRFYNIYAYQFPILDCIFLITLIQLPSTTHYQSSMLHGKTTHCHGQVPTVLPIPGGYFPLSIEHLMDIQLISIEYVMFPLTIPYHSMNIPLISRISPLAHWRNLLFMIKLEYGLLEFSLSGATKCCSWSVDYPMGIVIPLISK